MKRGERGWRATACATWWLMKHDVWPWLGLALVCLGVSIWLD